MPIIDSATGKINAALVIDDDGGEESIELTRQIAAELGNDVILYNLVMPDWLDNTKDDIIRQRLGQLPSNVKSLLLAAGDRKGRPTLGHQHAIDYLVASYNNSGEKNILFDYGFNKHAVEISNLLREFNVNFLPNPNFGGTFEPKFIQGGDYISGPDFLIIGPSAHWRRADAMDTNGYWPDFFTMYGYSEFAVEQVLRLQIPGEYSHIWNGGCLLYHLDMYLTYLGHDENGKYRFFIANVDCIDTTYPEPALRFIDSINAYLGLVRAQLESFFGVNNVVIETLSCELLLADFMYPAVQSAVYSFNNAIVEVTPDLKRYIMPTYNNLPAGTCAFDKAVTSVNKYFNVIRRGTRAEVGIPQVYVTSQKQSLHCIVAILDRTL